MSLIFGHDFYRTFIKLIYMSFGNLALVTAIQRDSRMVTIVTYSVSETHVYMCIVRRNSDTIFNTLLQCKIGHVLIPLLSFKD